jgi:palmitoyltransferase
MGPTSAPESEARDDGRPRGRKQKKLDTSCPGSPLTAVIETPACRSLTSCATMTGLAPRCVFRCFRALERLGDRVTGAAGPFFIAFAIALLSVGIIGFCALTMFPHAWLLLTAISATPVEVVQPTLNYPWITTPICMLIAINLLSHYYYVCTVSPGFVDEPPRRSSRSISWAKKRRTGGGRALTSNTSDHVGVRWSDDVNITKATTSKCRRCGVVRPEVSFLGPQ